MPTPIMHIALSEEILAGGDLPPAVGASLRENQGAFILGSTAPDVQTVSGQRRRETHFRAIPPVDDRPAHTILLETYPALARANQLPPSQAAFIAGYLIHILVDELWLDGVFRPYFLAEWPSSPYPYSISWPERSFLHNVLRTWLDRQDQSRIGRHVGPLLRQVTPRGWLPFVADEHLWAWRDWLAEQLTPGHTVQTAAVFAQRMGIPVAEIEAVLSSATAMEERVFRYVPRRVLHAFHDLSYRQSVALICDYLDAQPQPTSSPFLSSLSLPLPLPTPIRSHHTDLYKEVTE